MAPCNAMLYSAKRSGDEGSSSGLRCARCQYVIKVKLARGGLGDMDHGVIDLQSVQHRSQAP